MHEELHHHLGLRVWPTPENDANPAPTNRSRSAGVSLRPVRERAGDRVRGWGVTKEQTQAVLTRQDQVLSGFHLAHHWMNVSLLIDALWGRVFR